MRKLSYLLVGLFLTVGLVGISFGATKATKKTADKVYAVKGSISAVDATAGSITVKGEKSDVVLSVNAETKIKINGKASDLNGLKVGDVATVVYKKDGDKNIAKSITVGSSIKK
ncbi:MAG: hypothetical protein N2258_09045 [Brevinematales bacterium]|nr:hypothetical protein [Brevinematales bacterium]